MALSAVIGVDNSQAVSGQRVKCTITILNPGSGSSCNITQIAPYVSPAAASYNIGRPLLNLPEAPYYLAAGQSVSFTWTECFFKGQDGTAQSNAPTAAYPISVGANVYASDGSITTPTVATVLLYPNVGVNANTAISFLPIGGAFFANNLSAWFASLFACPDF